MFGNVTMNLPFPLNILYFDPWVSGIFTGIIVALFTIRFTLKENDRWRINKCIEYLGNEINWNRNKFVLYKENIESLKPVSLDKNVLSGIYKWVDEISAVDKGPVYSVFKFDAFNYYQSSDIPTYVGIGFDYMLKEFYSASKRFCFNISFISNRIAEFYTSGNLDPISNEFDRI